MKTFECEIRGITALMHHRMPEDELMGLLGIRESIKKPKEARTPREIAERYVYRTKDGKCYIPLKYISGAFIQASSDYKQKNSSRKSLKSVAGGVFRPMDELAVLIDDKGKALTDFEVDIQKATNHLKGAIAVVRPRFDKWGCKFQVQINDSILSPEIALQILEDSGRRVGIGSFRVAKGGFYGQFEIRSWKEV